MHELDHGYGYWQNQSEYHSWDNAYKGIGDMVYKLEL